MWRDKGGMKRRRSSRNVGGALSMHMGALQLALPGEHHRGLQQGVAHLRAQQRDGEEEEEEDEMAILSR